MKSGEKWGKVTKSDKKWEKEREKLGKVANSGESGKKLEKVVKSGKKWGKVRKVGKSGRKWGKVANSG